MHVGLVPPPAANSNHTFGFLLQTMLYLSNFTDHSPNNTMQDYYHLPMGAGTDPNQPKCYGVYGCFPTDFPWTTEQRRISLYPESPDKIRPQFPVFHKGARERPFMLDLNEPQDTRLAGIDPNGTVYVLAHGYIDAGDRPWLRDMVHGLIDSDPEQRATVVIVDWGGGSSPPYTQAVANIRLVGAIAAHVIHMIYQECGLPNLERVHMIGHSLGAHLSGYAGYTLQREFGLQLGRITGLDPAEPLFTDTDPMVRLDRSDAGFVDVVHTDAVSLAMGGLGMRAAIGHVDFYPNGGANNPGCDGTWSDSMSLHRGSLFGSIQQFLSCNHVRSYQFWLEAVRGQRPALLLPGSPQAAAHCPFMGITCSSYDDFRRGHCFRCDADGNRCVRFGPGSRESYRGLWSDRRIANAAEPMRVYFMTGGEGPFCRVHYKVTVVVSSSEESVLHGGEIGVLSLEVRSQRLPGELEKEERRRRKLSGWTSSEEEEAERWVDEERTDDERRQVAMGVGHTGVENSTETMYLSEMASYMEPGKTYAAVMAGRNVGVPTHATLNWEYHPHLLNPLTWRILATPRIYVDHIVVESMEYGTTLRLCSMYKDPVTSLSSKLFLAEYCKDKPK